MQYDLLDHDAKFTEYARGGGEDDFDGEEFRRAIQELQALEEENPGLLDEWSERGMVASASPLAGKAATAGENEEGEEEGASDLTEEEMEEWREMKRQLQDPEMREVMEMLGGIDPAEFERRIDELRERGFDVDEPLDPLDGTLRDVDYALNSLTKEQRDAMEALEPELEREMLKPGVMLSRAAIEARLAKVPGLRDDQVQALVDLEMKLEQDEQVRRAILGDKGGKGK